MTSELILSELWIYPVKSLGGIKLQEAQVEERGLQHDRRWLIIDANNRFVSQREHSEMTLIDVSLNESGLFLSHKTKPELGSLIVPFWPETLEILTVRVWEDEIEAILVNEKSGDWLSKALGIDVRLVFMPDSSPRPADPDYAPLDVNVSFADGFPYLLISQSSLNDLNSRLESPVEILRFRPNFVVTGGEAHQEDAWKVFKINDLEFLGVKPCARCIMTTIDPQTATKNSEPLKTLSTYRKRNNKIYFGQNLITKASGMVRVGDVIQL
jgi:uncharacterized protein